MHDTDCKREIYTLAAKWRQLRQHLKLYQSQTSPTTDLGKKYRAICFQLARKRSNLEVLAKQITPDANAQLHLTQAIVRLELTLAELKRKPKQNTERLECIATEEYMEDLTVLKKLRNLIVQKLYMIKMLNGCRPRFYDETGNEGYFEYFMGFFGYVYRMYFEKEIPRVFTNKELRAYVELTPPDCFNEIRRVFGNTPLRAGIVDNLVHNDLHVDGYVELAILEHHCSAWKSSDIVTRFTFTSNGLVFSNHGLAIFRTNQQLSLSFEEIKQHFENPDQVTVKPILNGRRVILIMYSYEGRAPRAFNRTPHGFTTFSVLRRTTSHCTA